MYDCYSKQGGMDVWKGRKILNVNVIFWKAVKKQIAASKTEQSFKKKKKKAQHIFNTQNT